MKTFVTFLGIAATVLLLSGLLSMAWIFYFLKYPDCTETTFHNLAGQAIKSIEIDADHVHMSLRPDQDGNLPKAFITGKFESGYEVELNFLFSDGTKLKTPQRMIPGEVEIIHVYKDKIAVAVERSSTW